MKSRFLAIAGLAAVIGTGATFGVLAQGGGVGSAPGSTAAPRKGAEKHPELRAALRNLNQAKKALTSAAHDFDGHREKALDLTQKAIDEVKLAFKADKR